ncbi:GNAT family N-acetyltransferase [Flavobacterium sp.]|uniref:GNAT family N-acetyltransferase n=1 Tax=Flavobacterium sp. TaxID=239 RepID=UPI003D6BA56B
MKDIAHENIKNLTSLWEKVSASFEGFNTKDEFNYTLVPNSDWPQKLWFTQQPNEDSLSEALKTLKASANDLSFSYWDDFNSPNYQMIETSGFSKKSEQVGMLLQFNQKIESSNRLDFKRVSDKKEAHIWAEIYPQSFGYTISSEILNRTKTEIEYYLAYFEGKAIGTAMVLLTGNVIGIHGVGVIPEMRKKGFAEEIMQFIINSAVDRNIGLATLQSSPMGKNIYLKMGFSEDFLMVNYKVPIV